VAIKGLYVLQNPDDAKRHFAAVGVEVEVVCVSSESNLNFGTNGTSLAERRAQRLAYRTLSRELGCVQDISGKPRVMAPRLVPDVARLPDHELVQPAVGLGFLENDNVNPACVGMTALGMGNASVVCNSFTDSPSTWWAYISTRGGTPFVVMGVLLCDWRLAHRGLVLHMMLLIKRQVEAQGLKYNPEHLHVWASPVDTIDGLREGVSVGDDDALQLIMADGEYEDYITLDGGTSDEAPHNLDVVGLALHQIFDAGLPHENLAGLYPATLTPRMEDDTKFRWGGTQDGGDLVSCVMAGTVRRSTR
jgi:hypothetical protein